MVKIESSERDGIKIFTVSGRLDGDGSIRLYDKINEQIDYKKDSLLLDVADVEFISSAGLRVLILAAKRIEHAFGLCNLPSIVQETFAITQLDKALFIYDDPASALKSMSKTS